MSILKTILFLSAVAPLTAACGLFGQQRTGGLEDMTRDTPEQAFLYFQAAARIERYDLEYETFAPEFRQKYGFTQAEYLAGRPLIYGEPKRILKALLSARIESVEPVGAPDLESARVARIVLTSDGYRGEVLVVRQPYYRIGVRGMQKPAEGDLQDLRRNVTVRDGHVLVAIPLDDTDWEIMGFDVPPTPADLNRVEVADRWSLLDIGDVFESLEGGRKAPVTEEVAP